MRQLWLPGGAGGEGPFAEELAQLWRRGNRPTLERLALAPIADAVSALAALRRGRGDFAIVDVATAFETLGEPKGLAAIGVLWPELLHAVTRGRGLRIVELPLKGPVRVAPNARYAFDALVEWSQEQPEQLGLLHLQQAGDAERPAPQPDEVLLLSGAPPIEGLAAALGTSGNDRRLIPISTRMVEELKLIYPWLQTAPLLRGAYPTLDSNMELPARYLVMVSRRSLPDPTVQKMLTTLYEKGRAVSPYDPRFGEIQGARNQLFAKLLPYHPLAARVLRLEQAGR
ncbi:MAG: hypothetical protein HY423_09600 [Candidatus Lambdaproteobacteria bacterium]|nr:hypothetical protein [Candidatus Lambdaproteobacteria bacterium]